MSADQTAEQDFQTYMWVVAHPDDLDFPSGGTVAKFAKEGKKVILIQVTSGDRGTADRSFTPPKLAATREAEELESARRLGVSEVVFLREPDGAVVPDLSRGARLTRTLPAGRTGVTIRAADWRVLVAVEAARTLGDARKTLGTTRYALSSCVADLVEMGVLELTDSPA